MSSVHYVLAAWPGARRSSNITDGSVFLKKHLEYLGKVKHNLSLITVCLPYPFDLNNYQASEMEAFNEILGHIISLGSVQNTPIKYCRRLNRQLSYGSYSEIYSHYREEFDYYIFVEDDFIFVLDNFDSILIDQFNSRPNCGYLCSFVRKIGNNTIAGISNGISSSKVLEEVFKKNEGSLVDISNELKDKSDYDDQFQLGFSRAFTNCGFEIHDFKNNYRGGWRNRRDITKFEYYGTGDVLILPYEMI